MNQFKVILSGWLMLTGIAAQAAPLSEAPDYYPYDPYPAPMYPVPVGGSSFAFCQTQTFCPNTGLPIGCYAYGSAPAYAACTWQVIQGAYVECTGFNDLGIWTTSWARCY